MARAGLPSWQGLRMGMPRISSLVGFGKTFLEKRKLS